MTDPLGRVRDFVRNIVNDGHLAVGAQISIRHKEVEHQITAGRGGIGRPVTSETRLRAYCAAKPLTAFAAIAALDHGGIDLNTPIGSILEDELEVFPAHVSEYTARHLLRHETTMLEPRGTEVALWAPRSVLSGCAQRAHQVQRGAGYSEVTSWLLLVRAAERVSGTPGAAIIARYLLEPAGLTRTTFGMSREAAIALAEEVDANVTLRGPDATPMLSDRSPRNIARFEPAFGAYTTASDLSRFYEFALHPPDPPISGRVEAMVGDRRDRIHDPGLNLECSFGQGVMVGLDDFQISRRSSAAAYGHSGFIGTAFGLADPAVDVAIGCIFIGITDAESTASYLRPTLVDMIYDEVLA